MSKYDGVHSCGPNCTQPLCVANRRIAELEQEKATLIKLGQEDSRYQNLLSETQSLRARITALESSLWKCLAESDELTDKQFRDKFKQLCGDLFRPKVALKQEGE